MAPLDNSWYKVMKGGKYQKHKTNRTKNHDDSETIVNYKVNNDNIDNSKEANNKFNRKVKKSSLKKEQQWTFVQKKTKKVRFDNKLYTNSTNLNNKPGGEMKKQKDSGGKMENVFKSNKFNILEHENCYDKYDEVLDKIEFQINKISEIEDDIKNILKMTEKIEDVKARADLAMNHLPDHPTRNARKFQCQDCSPPFSFYYPNEKAQSKYLLHMRTKHGIPEEPAKAYFRCFINGTSRKFVPEVASVIQKDMDKSLLSSQDLNQSVSLLTENSVNDSTTNSEFANGIKNNDTSTQQIDDSQTPYNTPVAGRKRKELMSLVPTGEMKRLRELEEVEIQMEDLTNELRRDGVDAEDEEGEIVLPDDGMAHQEVIVSDSMNASDDTMLKIEQQVLSNSHQTQQSLRGASNQSDLSSGSSSSVVVVDSQGNSLVEGDTGDASADMFFENTQDETLVSVVQENQELARLQKTIELQNATIVDLRNDNQAAKTEILTAKLLVEKLEEDKGKLEEEKKAEEEEVKKLVNENKELKYERKRVEDLLRDVALKHSKELEDYKKEVFRLKKKVEELEKKSEEGKEDQGVLYQHTVTQKEKLEKNKESNESLQKENAALRNENAAFKKNMNDLNKKFVDVKKDNNNLQEEVNKLKKSQDTSNQLQAQTLQLQQQTMAENNKLRKMSQKCTDSSCQDDKLCGLNHIDKMRRSKICWYEENLPKGCRKGDSCLDIHNPRKQRKPLDEPMDQDEGTLDEDVDDVEERRRRSTRPPSKEVSKSKPKPKHQSEPRRSRSRSRHGPRHLSNDGRWDRRRDGRTEYGRGMRSDRERGFERRDGRDGRDNGRVRGDGGDRRRSGHRGNGDIRRYMYERESETKSKKSPEDLRNRLSRPSSNGSSPQRSISSRISRISSRSSRVSIEDPDDEVFEEVRPRPALAREVEEEIRRKLLAGKSSSLSRAEATTSAIVSRDKHYDGYETDDFELVDNQVLPKLVPRHARPNSNDRNLSSSKNPVTIQFKKKRSGVKEKVTLPDGWKDWPNKRLREFLRKCGVSGLSSDEEVDELREVFRRQGSLTGVSSLAPEDPAHQNGQTRRTPTPTEIDVFLQDMRVQGQVEARSEPQRTQLLRIRQQNNLLSPELLRREIERRMLLEENSGSQQRQRLGSLQLQSEEAGNMIRDELRRRTMSYQDIYAEVVNQDSGRSFQQLYEDAVKREKEEKERMKRGRPGQ